MVVHHAFALHSFAVQHPHVVENAKELLKQLVLISAKAWMYRFTADKLIDLIENIQPIMEEIQNSGVELPPHRQAQIGMFCNTLEKGRKLTEEVLSTGSWNKCRHIVLAIKMQNLEKEISDFIMKQISVHILADVLLLRANSNERFDRVESRLETMTEHLGSMKTGGGGMIKHVHLMAFLVLVMSLICMSVSWNNCKNY